MKIGEKWTPRDVPFKVDRAAPGTLSKQMADGIREAIVSGRFKPGDILPTILEWSHLLGVSIRVPEKAVATLVREGLLIAQKGVGCTVNPRKKNVWLGRVLVVIPDGDHVFYYNIIVGRLRANLSMAGYLFTQVTVLSRPDGRYDFRQLAHELRIKPDFTLLFEDRPTIARFLSKSGSPFGVFAKTPCALPGCVANFRIEHGAAVPEFAAHCVRAGVRSVLQVSTSATTIQLFDAVPALLEAGVQASKMEIPGNPQFVATEAVAQGALSAFRERFSAAGRAWLPDVFLFLGDFLATGALVAMQEAGIRIPDDVKVVSVSNKGLGPVYPVPITRIEYDGFRIGDTLSKALCAFLAGRKIRDSLCSISPEYIVGESFR
jgi:DNA-binding LacI/PurR family transcriptional regulator